MAGKPGRSGPPGNLNGCKRPWNAFWRRKALHKRDRWILGVLEDYATGLMADKPEFSNGERRMIELAQTARGATMLILAEAARQGFTCETEGGWDLAPGAKELGKFLNAERSALQVLGLGRRVKQVPALEDYLRGDEGRVAMPANGEEPNGRED